MMTRYVAFVDGQPGAYGVTFPDCPGCTAMGATMDEALRDAADALREWTADRIADGFAPIAPRTIEAIRADPSVADDLADVILAGVPLLLDAGRAVRANVSFDARTLRMIDDAARERGVTRSAFLATAAREKILTDG